MANKYHNQQWQEPQRTMLRPGVQKRNVELARAQDVLHAAQLFDPSNGADADTVMMRLTRTPPLAEAQRNYQQAVRNSDRQDRELRKAKKSKKINY